MNNPIIINARFLTQPITGTQRFALEISRALKRKYPEIILLCPDNIIHKDIANELDVKVVGKIKKGIIWEQIELPFLLKRYGNPVLINLCNLAPLFYSNNVVAVLDLSFYLHPEWFSPVFSRLYNFIIPRVATKARRVVTISENSKADIVNYFKVPSDKVDIVHPSVSENFINYRDTQTNKYDKYILAVSSIDPRKNFIGLIKAFKKANLNNIKLVIVGSEHKVFANSDIRDEVAGDKHIIFTGYIDDNELANLYQHALLFAYPSFFEGFGIPPLEAMACGCPTLVSNTTSLPEVCGDASVYVDPYDIDSIKEGIIRLSSDYELRSSLILKGYNQLRKFDWDSSALKLLNIVKASISYV